MPKYLRNKIELFTAFLQSTTPDILAIFEHGLKEEEVTQCALEGYTVASHFCRKEYEGAGYSSWNITQHKPLKWVTKKSVEKNH
jgi:exonuclease III